MKNRTVDISALTICQNIIYTFKTRRQVQHKHKRPSDAFRIPRSQENPQVLGWPSPSIMTLYRNKTMMNLLHAQNYCISYNHTLLLETAIANAVVEKSLMGFMYHHSSRRVHLFSLLLTILTLLRTPWTAKTQHMLQSQQCISKLMHQENK